MSGWTARQLPVDEDQPLEVDAPVPDSVVEEWLDRPLPGEPAHEEAAGGAEAFYAGQPRDRRGRFAGGGGGVLPITASEARGNSRPVSAEEFGRLAQEGHDKLASMRAHQSPPAALDRDWDQVRDTAFAETQKSWGGATFDAHTGKTIQPTEGYVLSIKNHSDSVTLAEDAKRADFDRAMDTARSRFGDELAMQGGHLGVFHDDDNRRIDIDPVIVVGSRHDVETIGAATHAIGGAYSFADGNGYWPPHVAEEVPAVAAAADPPDKGEERHWRGLGEWYANVRKTQHGAGGGGGRTSAGLSEEGGTVHAFMEATENEIAADLTQAERAGQVHTHLEAVEDLTAETLMAPGQPRDRRGRWAPGATTPGSGDLGADLQRLGFDQERSQRISHTVDQLGDRYGDVGGGITRVQEMPSGMTEALTAMDAGDTLFVDAKRLNDRDLTKAVAAGRIAHGEERIEGPIVHEYAHRIMGAPGHDEKVDGAVADGYQAARRAGYRPQDRMTISRDVSELAATNIDERSAEVFASYHLGGANRAPWVQAWGEAFHRTLGVDPTPLGGTGQPPRRKARKGAVTVAAATPEGRWMTPGFVIPKPPRKRGGGT